jgi:hypothetical protein
LRFDVQLTRCGSGRWNAKLDDGSLILTASKRPRTEIAQILLEHGAHPLDRMVIRFGAEIIAFDLLGFAGGRPVTCADVDVVEKD